MTDWRLLLAGALAAGVLLSPGAEAGEARIQGVGGAFSVPVTSAREARWQTVIPQQYDYSCGSAAVATLLTFHYGRATNEAEVFQAMYAAGNQRKIQRQGFSMLDMKRFLDGLGLRSDGFRMTLDQVAKLGVPGITMIDLNGYRHFVVIKGIDERRVVIGDPALGVRVMPRQRFEAIWSGAVLAARAKVQVARDNFNETQDWRVRPQAPVGQGISRSGLGVFSLTLPARNELGR